MSAAATERVGRYQLLDPIGVGPSGTVSRAKVFGVAGFERQFAIKRFHPELTSTAALAQALSAAARSYGSLEHPRIARMSEFGVAQGTTFTAVEYVAGLDALRLIAEAKMAGATLAPGGSLALVSQAARAVGYAHGRGLTHLGLAPTNVMITADGDIKITDFGILAAALPPRPVETPRLANRVPYLAPEQLANEATSAATDVFALGVLAYELVTGHRTFRGETAQQIAQSVMAGPPIEPPLPRPIVRVLQRCLARSPFERFPDARALADALDAALRVAPVPGTRKDIGAQVKQTMERIAALHEGEMSGVLALNLGTGPAPRFGELPSPAERPPPTPVAAGRPDDFATDEFAKLQAGPAPRPTPTPPRPPDLPGSTVPDLRAGAISTVTGVPPAPIPVPQGVAPPPTPTTPPAMGTSTLVGVPGAKPPPLPGSRTGQPAPAPPAARSEPPAARPEPPPAAKPAPPAARPAPPAARPEPPAASPAPTRPAGLPRLPTPRPLPDAPVSPASEAAPRAPARSAAGAAPPAGPNEPAEPAPQGEKRPSRRITADLSAFEELPDSALMSEEISAVSAPPAAPGAPDSSESPPASPTARGEARPRSLIGYLPDEPSAFAGGTNVEIQLPPGFADAPGLSEPAPEQALGPGGTSLALPPPPAIPHAPAEPAPQAPFGAVHDDHARPGSQAGYPSTAGFGMSSRDADRAGSPGRVGATARSRQRLVLILGGVVAAAALAIGGWVVYGAISGGDDRGGGSAAAAGGGSAVAAGGSAARDGGVVAGGGAPDARGGAPDARGSAPQPPADAAIAAAAVDAAPEPPKPPSELSIVSTPPGARVFLDGADAGVTPLKLPGTSDRHTVALLLTGHELYVAQVDGHGQFSIPLKQIAPNPDFAGIKVIQCKDKDRYYVFVDGKPSGQTCPTERINTTLGPHTVEVYDVVTEQRRKWQIDIKDGRLSYRIRIDPS